jgi:hypothetical protein
MKIGSAAQPTDFSLDVLGRYVCNTFDEAKAASEPPTGGRPFDFIIVGGGTFGSALAEHLWFRSIGRSERVLVLDAGPFLVPEHVQNLPAIRARCRRCCKSSPAAERGLGSCLEREREISRAGFLHWRPLIVLGRLVTKVARC